MPLYQIEAKLGGELLQSLSKEVSTASIKVRFFDVDNPTVQRTPDANTKLFEMDPLNTSGKQSEYFVCDSHSTTDGVTTLVNVTRGLPRDPTFPVVASLANANQWDAGDPIGSATQHYNDNLVKAYFEGEEPIPGDMTFDGDYIFNGDVIFNGTSRVPVYLNAAARDVAITSPVNGMEVYLTTEGVFTDYTGGVWTTRASGATPNASETVTGKVRLNNTTRTDNATDTDGGDPTVNKPSETARVIQQQKYTYGVESGVADAYVVTLIPAATALVAGLAIEFKAINANTGASTLNLNGLGAQAIVKGVSTPLEQGDIVANQIIRAVYDGTNFVIGGVPTAILEGTAPIFESGNNWMYSYRTIDNWAESDLGAGSKTVNVPPESVALQTGANSGDYETYYRTFTAQGPGAGGGGSMHTRFDDLVAGQKVIFEANFQAQSPNTNTEIRIGFGQNTAHAHSEPSNQATAKLRITNATAEVLTSNGVAASPKVTGITISDINVNNRLRIEWNPGINVVFKINNVVVHTEAADFPTISTASPIVFFAGIKTTTTASKSLRVGTDPYIAIQKV